MNLQALDRITITGGNGFIGKHLVKKILSGNIESIDVISNSPNISPEILLNDDRLTYHIADIRDTNKVSKIIKDTNPDTCVHLAAKISVLESIKNPQETIEINVKGTQNVLEACYCNQVSNFIFASSAAVYGHAKELPISEDHSLYPLSPYGTSKMLAEQHVRSYENLNKIRKTVSFRIFNVYGSGQANETDVISRFATRLSRGLAPIIYGNGDHTRDFVSVEDVVDCILLSTKLIEKSGMNDKNDLKSPLVFNVGTGKPTSISYLAQKMLELFELDLKPIYEKGEVDNRVILHSYADISRVKEILHFHPRKSIEAGLRDIIDRLSASK